MASFDERQRKILDGCFTVLRVKELDMPEHWPYLVRWVKITTLLITGPVEDVRGG